MAQLFRKINPSFSIFIFVSYLGLAFAQITLQDCARSTANNYYGLYNGIYNKPTSDPMKWCPLWAAVCSHIHRTCPSLVTCEFANYDEKITTPYDPNSPSNYAYFATCKSCNVDVSIDPTLLFKYGVEIPKAPLPKSDDPKEMSKEMSAENPSAYSVTAAVTALLVVGGIAGSVIAVKTSATPAGFLGAGAGGATTTITSPKTGSGNGQSIIDAVTLLLHFQSISTSGLLSLSYPTLYRFFTFNFAWANLIIASDAFKAAVSRIGANPSCLRDIGSLNPALAANPHSATGMTILAARYNLDRATIGGLVYLAAIIGVAVSLAVFVLISVLLHTLNTIYKSAKLQAQVEIWPSRASSLSLRLFIWVLGSIATFAMYQFVEPCSSASLIIFASIELSLIILTLLVVSVVIIKTANTQGPEALYQLSESEESIYSRKWGSLYAFLKPAFYWFFIPDYVCVFVKSIIVGVGQDSGLAQVCALIGVELTILLALLRIRPYSTSSVTAFHIFSTCKRLVASACLLVFWADFNVPTNYKRVIGIILMTVECTYAVALFVVILLNGGARIVKWNAERKERRRAFANNEVTMTTNPIVPPMKHIDSDFSNISPIQNETQLK